MCSAASPFWYLLNPRRKRLFTPTAHARCLPIRFSWGSQVDGCGDDSAYPGGYKAMGQALYNSGRPIVYSCSWPAYLPSDQANYTQYILDGCNLWRNWDDIQCSWSSLASIIDHWGTWGKNLSACEWLAHLIFCGHARRRCICASASYNRA